MRDWDDGHMDNGWGIAMMLGVLGFSLLLAVAIGLAIVWLVRSSETPTTPSAVTNSLAAGPTDGNATGSPEQILAERLARGDIDPEDYTARLRALKDSSAL
jgi:putative membrane protein